MKDRFGREISYLRISVTDECNLRCLYCMPAHPGDCGSFGCDLMSADEIVEIAEAAKDLGITKIRITGGEPLIRPDVIEICSRVSAVRGIREVVLTTNGVMLAEMAGALKTAGVSRLNISLDTLQTDKYTRITRRGSFGEVSEGIGQALEAGLRPIKLNTVLIGGFNDDEIIDFAHLSLKGDVEVRFIELMPIGACASFPKQAFVRGDTVLERIPELIRIGDSGVARMYQFPDGRGRIGIISSVNQHFCQSCNRIRLTSDGRIKPCLHSREEIPVRGLHGSELRAALRRAIYEKPAQHAALTGGNRSETGRYMNQIGG